MSFEVENKFRVADPAHLRQRIEALGAEYRGMESHSDSYFNHPSRDFRQTDEALRIRNANGEICLTFKGPRFNTGIKIREEIELPLAPSPNAEQSAIAILHRLGFQFVACVKKRRDVYHLSKDRWSIEICLDDVDQLGTFAEIELIAEADDLGQAKQLVIDLQHELDLGEPESRSYLKMLLATNSSSPA